MQPWWKCLNMAKSWFTKAVETSIASYLFLIVENAYGCCNIHILCCGSVIDKAVHLCTLSVLLYFSLELCVFLVNRVLLTFHAQEAFASGS